MVRRLHEAGIEVILDVVYNHTAEGNHLGPTLSFRGIDNASYYMLGEDRRYYFDTTGCGNTVNLRHPRVLQMVMDSLRYWVEECHVDGFRFDLATALGREYDQLRHQRRLLRRRPPGPGPAARQDDRRTVGSRPQRLSGRQLPARLGRVERPLPRHHALASGRATAACCRRSAQGMLGSADLYDHQGRKPWASVNFVTAHDGFTLADLWSYDAKHNEANGEGNRDGHDDNRSWNCGVEGPTEDPDIRSLRDRLRRNTIATLLLSQGTPMILMGDEIGRTQLGNNNAYCQDNDITWMRWRGMTGRDFAFMEFVRGVVAIRKRYAFLHASEFLHGNQIHGDGTRDVIWYRPDGVEMDNGAWSDPSAKVFGVMLGDIPSRLLILVNSYHAPISFLLPNGGRPYWRVRVDAGRGEIDPPGRIHSAGETLELEGRTVLLLVGETMMGGKTAPK